MKEVNELKSRIISAGKRAVEQLIKVGRPERRERARPSRADVKRAEAELLGRSQQFGLPLQAFQVGMLPSGREEAFQRGKLRREVDVESCWILGSRLEGPPRRRDRLGPRPGPKAPRRV